MGSQERSRCSAPEMAARIPASRAPACPPLHAPEPHGIPPAPGRPPQRSCGPHSRYTSGSGTAARLQDPGSGCPGSDSAAATVLDRPATTGQAAEPPRKLVPAARSSAGGVSPEWGQGCRTVLEISMKELESKGMCKSLGTGCTGWRLALREAA